MTVIVGIGKPVGLPQKCTHCTYSTYKFQNNNLYIQLHYLYLMIVGLSSYTLRDSRFQLGLVFSHYQRMYLGYEAVGRHYCILKYNRNLRCFCISIFIIPFRTPQRSTINQKEHVWVYVYTYVMYTGHMLQIHVVCNIIHIETSVRQCPTLDRDKFRQHTNEL